MRLWQPVQFFHAAAQPHAKHFAATNRNQRVRELVALAQRMVGRERVQIREDSLTPPGREGNHGDKSCDHQRCHQKEHACIHTAEEQNAHRDHYDASSSTPTITTATAMGQTARKNRSFTSMRRTM